ncbi:MAG: FAD-binding protein [Limisphaerales bacterium]
MLAHYAGDKWFAAHQPDAVALPRSTRSVVAILHFANKNKIPVTARGGGYGYVGGCVPARGGIVLSLDESHFGDQPKGFRCRGPASGDNGGIPRKVREPKALLSARSCQSRA